MAMFCSDRMALSYDGKKAKDIDLVGTEATYFQIKNYEVVNGRAFTAQEVRAGRTVVVLGDLVAEKLFAGQDPVGKDVVIEGLPYRSVGVGAKQGNRFGISPDKVAVHAVCRENVFWETLESLKAAGASAMLVLPVEKMLA